MLNNAPFKFDLIRKYVGAFGVLFKDVYVDKFVPDQDAPRQRIRVPISYGPRDKTLARVVGDPDIARAAAAILPAMTFEMGAPVYAPQRKLNSVGYKVVEDTTHYKRQFNPVPYDIPFTLHVLSRYFEDGNAILEQIVPFFTPEFPMTLHLIPETDQTWDVPVILNSIGKPAEEWDADFKTRRHVSWELNFTMRGLFFGPIAQHPVIKFVDVRLYQPFTNTAAEGVGISTAVDRVTTQPGLTANGEPTSNVALSIPYQDIQATDDYGIIVNIYGNLDPAEGTGGADQPIED
jgi:hypothetical protein